MRGFPFLNLLIALLISGVLLPFVWQSTRDRTGGKREAAVSAPVPAEAGVPSHLSLRFVHSPAKVKVTAGDTVVKEWTAPNGALQLEDSVTLPLHSERLELGLQIEWPAGTTDPTNVVLEVEPEKHESRRDVVWSSGGTVDDIVVLSWKS